MENTKQKRDIILKRLIFLFVPVFVLALALNKAGLVPMLGLVLASVLYLFMREKLWYLLVLAAPSLCLGTIVNIPVTSGWVYEAHLAEVFLILLAAIYLFDLYLYRQWQNLKIDKIAYLLLALTLLSALSFFWIKDARLYVYALKIPVFGFLAYFMALNLIDKKKKLEYFLYGLAVTALVLSGQVFYKFYTMGFSSEFFFNRSNILIPIGPIATTAAILAFLAPLLLGFYYYLHNSSKAKPLILFGFFLALFAVFLTLGKGAILSLLFGLFVIYCLLKQKRIAIALFFFWFLAFAYFGFQPYFEGLYERLKTTFVDVNTEFRLKEYQIGFKLISENPLTGVGVGQQIYQYQKILNQEQGNFVNNLFLQSMIDLGIIGLLLTLLLLKNVYSKLRSTLRQVNENHILFAGVVASGATAFLNGMVEVTFYALPYAIIFWITIGAFFGFASRTQR